MTREEGIKNWIKKDEWLEKTELKTEWNLMND